MNGDHRERARNILGIAPEAPPPPGRAAGKAEKSQPQTLLLGKAGPGQGQRFSLVRRWRLRRGRVECGWVCAHVGMEEQWAVACLRCPSAPPSPDQHKLSARASPGPASPNTVTSDSMFEAHSTRSPHNRPHGWVIQSLTLKALKVGEGI